MSEGDPQQILTYSGVDTSIRDREHIEQNNNIVEQVVNNQVFKMLLKDIVQQLFRKKTLEEQQDKLRNQNQVTADGFIEQISDALMLIAHNETNKKIKQAEKFLNQLYELKVKELEDKFQAMVQKKIKEIQIKMNQIQQKTRIEPSLMLSPVKPPMKMRQILQLSVSDQVNKRMQLKQKILNCSAIPEQRHSSITQVNSNSLFSDSLNDAALERLSEKIKQLQQSLKQQLKVINNKMSTIKSQTKADMQTIENDIKEQINSGFQGIWNVISNLEKRMMI